MLQHMSKAVLRMEPPYKLGNSCWGLSNRADSLKFRLRLGLLNFMSKVGVLHIQTPVPFYIRSDDILISTLRE